MAVVDRCFFCTTPFQVVSAIALESTFSGQADLYIVDQFQGYKEIGERIRHEMVFRDVRYVEERKLQPWRFSHDQNSFYVHVMKVLAYFRGHELMRLINPESDSYETIFISSNAFTGRIASSYLMKRYGTRIVLFDDGTGSYCNPGTIRNQTMERRVRALAFGNKVLSVVPDRYLYSPELYRACGVLPQNCEIEQIPSWNENEEVLSKLDRVFLYGEFMLPKAKAIEICSEEQYNVFLRCLDMIQDFCQIDGFSIKIHPRNAEGRLFYSQRYSLYEADNSVPFEIIIAHMNGFEGVTLITSFSTAVFSPIIILNEEPVIILLYRIIGLENVVDSYSQKYIDCVREMYKHDERVIVPETLDELREALESLRENDGSSFN